MARAGLWVNTSRPWANPQVAPTLLSYSHYVLQQGPCIHKDSPEGVARRQCAAEGTAWDVWDAINMLLKCVSDERDPSDISELADESLARKVVAKFGASWASMQAVLQLPCPKAPELREIAARCCTLAMRADRLVPAWVASIHV